MVKSLAWRIQLWYALMMLVVIAGLGAFLYVQIERAVFDRIDTELEGTAQLIDGQLRSLSPEELERGDVTIPALITERHILPPGGRPPPPGERSHRPPPRPPRRDRPAGPPPRRDLDVPAYAVWRSSGELLLRSDGMPPDRLREIPRLREGTALIQPGRERRDAYLRGPQDTVIVVSRSVRREWAELRSWRWLILGSGAGALLVTLVGGAWLTRRALGPLQTMSDTAASISAENLAGRIDVATLDIELAGLAQTLNAAFDRLEADIQKKSRFAADASHELRTPLTIILGYLEFALSQPQLEPATRETLQASLRAARRMKALIEQLLLLARADAGKLEPQRQTFDLSAAAEECVELLAPLAHQREVKLATDLSACDVQGDPRLLSQAMINLITNAIQHNRPGGTVEVATRGYKDCWLLSVRDTGPGIDAAAQPHIFERFYRADAARSRESGGAGLGLAISQSIAQAHGGEIQFTSRMGQGTEFTLRLPRLPTESSEL